MPEEAYVGLFLSSHNPDVKETVVFRHVRVIKPVKVGFQPYRDYIGSRLEVMNVTNGHRNVYYSSRVPFEAPNWLPDGSALIYNASGDDPATRGRLWKFDLADAHAHRSSTPASPFATTTTTCCRSTARSSPSATRARTTASRPSSRMPTRGGVPKRITPLTPSYMHGWTPDAKWLIYTGGRMPKGAKDNEFDIYKIASDGSGKEINLTNSPGLDDGPEVSPDGKWIYFNSTRSGQMQIWRMDARRQEPGTRDQRCTSSTTGSRTSRPTASGSRSSRTGSTSQPSDHPYYKHCYLRIMPTDGSAPPKVIAYVYGGQGTINVPSWSPDGTHIAFVSNSDAL